MTLFIDTNFEIGQKVKTSFAHAKGGVMDAELYKDKSQYRVQYLVEFENRERRWMVEEDLEGDAEE